MKWKFKEGMPVVGKNLQLYHKLKGFNKNDVLTCYSIDKGKCRNSDEWGLWIASTCGSSYIRIQDITGVVTGNGQYFEEVKTENSEVKEAPANEESNGIGPTYIHQIANEVAQSIVDRYRGTEWRTIITGDT
jgi:hypothetical protein